MGKTMMIWSEGDSKASYAKKELIGYSIIFVELCIVHILSFTMINPHDDQSHTVSLLDHFCMGVVFIVLLGWLTMTMIYGITLSVKHIKQNKLIPIYVYNMDTFMKMGELPNDKFILYVSDCCVVVIAEKRYREESMRVKDHLITLKKVGNENA